MFNYVIRAPFAGNFNEFFKIHDGTSLEGVLTLFTPSQISLQFLKTRGLTQMHFQLKKEKKNKSNVWDAKNLINSGSSLSNVIERVFEGMAF